MVCGLLRKFLAQHLPPDHDQWELFTGENKIRTPIYAKFDDRIIHYISDFLPSGLNLKPNRKLLHL